MSASDVDNSSSDDDFTYDYDSDMVHMDDDSNQGIGDEVRTNFICIKNIEESVPTVKKLLEPTYKVNHYNPQEEDMECETTTCQICFYDVISMVDLPCGHQFCQNCCQTYFKTKLLTEGGGPSIACLEVNCTTYVDSAIITRLVSEEVLARYRQSLINLHVKQDDNLSWCPAPHCTCVIKVTNPGSFPVQCCCGWSFCFRCKEKDHHPVDCDRYMRFKLHISHFRNDKTEDIKNLIWMNTNTKQCPKCRKNIEKASGCNHIICPPSCNFHFCWHCLGEWSFHIDVDECNLPEGGRPRPAENRNEDLQGKLLSVGSNPYVLKYLSQVESLEKEQYHITYDAQTLRRIRETLMRLYAFAFYLDKRSPSAVLFENSLTLLENSTEGLAEFIAGTKRLYEGNVNSADECRTRSRQLVDFVASGYRNGSWSFLD